MRAVNTVKSLERKLAAAHARLERIFWGASGLSRYREAGRKPRPLTPAEVAEVTDAIDQLQGDDYSEAIYDAGRILVEAGWMSAKTLLDLQIGYDVVPAAALAVLKGYAKQFAFLVVEREKKALHDALEQSFMQGEGPKAAAKRIAQTFRDGYHVYDETGTLTRRMPTGAWSKVVARTELSRASNLGNLSLYLEAGIQKVRWMAADGPNTCPECSSADDEVVPIGTAFPFVDVTTPPAHPNCVCVLVPLADELLNFRGPDETQLAAQAANQAALDRYNAQKGGGS